MRHNGRSWWLSFNKIGTAVKTLKGFLKVAVKTVAHGLLGGTMSAAMGGGYFSGFAAGAIGSLAASGTQGILKGVKSGFWKAAGTIGGGSLSGGVGSVISGGKFWDGFRNGAISASLNHVAHMIQKGIQQKKYSIKGSDGTELNPDGYQISNKKLRNSIIGLYDELKAEYGDRLEFQITGGDRYNVNGVNYSSTDGSFVKRSKPTAHNIEKGARAVDLRIKLDGHRVRNHEIIQPFANRYELHYQKGYYPIDYPKDFHHHLFLANFTYNYAKNN